MQIHPKYNIKPIDVSDLGEQIFKGLPKDEFHTVTAFLTGKPRLGDPESIADESIYFEFSNRQLKGWRIFALWKLYKYIKSEKFDIVVCNRFKPVNMMLILNRYLNVKMCIGIVHGFGDYDRSYRKKQLRKWVMPNWKFIGVSPAVKDYLMNLKSGLTENNTLAITNAIDIKKAEEIQLSKQKSREYLGLPQNKLIIGAVGRLVSVKGHKFLIEAFSIVSKTYPESELAIIGDGKELESLQKQINDLGISSKIHLLGFRQDALQYIKAFDIFVMPSLAEGLGLALLEAMSAKIPIIASSVPAMLPLITGAGAQSVQPGNVNDLVIALSNYLEITDAEREGLGNNAYNYLCGMHDLKSFQKKYLEIFRSVIYE